MSKGSRLVLVRRLAVALLTVLCLAASALLPVAGAATAATNQTRAVAYDHSLHAADCDLLGRDFVPHQGCSRTHCVPGSVPYRKTYGAEACALRGAPKGYGYVATVDFRTCRALHRRWIGEVNYCASNPDRDDTALYGAPQCRRPASVYVNLSETDGYFDECLTTERAAELADLAIFAGTSLTQEVSDHSAVQCPLRPGVSFVDGTCVPDPSFTPSGAGVLVIGDSLTWRGTDELAGLRPTFALDGEPSRPPTELAARLAAYRALHGDPTGLVVELGTVPATGWTKQDLVRVLASLPASTRVMLVQPYYVLRYQPLTLTPQSKQVDGWMRAIARSRDRTCTADWPAYNRAHPGTLQDGVHVKHALEGRWAQWVSQQWSSC